MRGGLDCERLISWLIRRGEVRPSVPKGTKGKCDPFLWQGLVIKEKMC